MSTFDALQTEVIARLGNRTDIGTRSATWINDALYEIAHSPEFSFRELDTTHTFLLEQFTTSYQLADVPSFWFPLHLFVVTTTKNHEVFAKHIQELMNMATDSTGRPQWYALYDNALAIYPGASADFVGFGLTMFYRKRLDLMSAGSEFPLGYEWEELVKTLAVVKGLEGLQRFEEAAAYKATIYEPLVKKRLSHLELEEPIYETTIGVRLQ